MMDEYGKIAIPSDMTSVWMNETELSELFGTIIPTLRAAIRTVYKDGALKPCDVERYVKLSDGCGMDVYSLQMIVALAFRINTAHANTVRCALLERMMCRRRKEKAIVFFSLDGLASVGLA